MTVISLNLYFRIMSLQDEIKTQSLVADGYIKRYTEPHALVFQKYLAEKIIRLAKPQGLILDNGCGPGYFSSLFLGDYDVIGVDISEEMLAHAKRNMNNVVLANSENLPFVGNYFDVVFSRSLIHHLADPQKGIREVARVLRKDGRAVFVDTLSTPVSYLPRKILSKTEYFSCEHKNFREGELARMIKNSGLNIIKKEYCGYVGYALVSAPDIFNPLRFIPFKANIAKTLMVVDEILSKIPVINKWMALGIIFVCQKP